MPAFHFPVETWLAIFRHLDVPDIVRTRGTSQYLNQVSRCRDVWVHAYHKANYVRPPGPFPSQSTAELENALVTSFRIHRNIQAGGAARKLKEIPYTGIDLGVSLVFGQFVLIMFKDEIRCYNVNVDGASTGPRVIYRPTGGVLTHQCQRVSAFDVNGHPFACLVLKEETRPEGRTRVSIHVLKVTEQSELTLDLLHQFEHDKVDIYSVDLGPRVIIVEGVAGSGDVEFVVALDVHARVQFQLPPLTDVSWEVDETPEWMDMTCFSTSTHILLARSFYTGAAGYSTFIRAFPISLANMRAGLVPLSCSHLSRIPSLITEDITLLHDAVYDPSTQDILVMIRADILRSSFDDEDTSLLVYGTLRLGKSDHGGVGAIAFQQLGLLNSLYEIKCPYRTTFNGTGRSFSEQIFGNQYLSKPKLYTNIMLFEYNACDDGDCNGDCDNNPIGRVGKLHFLKWSSTLCYLADSDPYLGRICLRYPTSGKDSVIEILDLAV